MKKPNFIYIGPTIPGLGLKKNTIYRSEALPEPVARLVKNLPMARSLYVKTSALAETSKRLTEKGSLEYTATQEMLAIARTAPR
jgi:hypothetical protein